MIRFYLIAKTGSIQTLRIKKGTVEQVSLIASSNVVRSSVFRIHRVVDLQAT